ncbi:hypothetical protein [Streptomyces sp. NPDC059278]|uniref:hypothetical protein n=1 Tax=Streptomyces sp. NPDC059278 TaxID=3346801 RepID=UPI00368104DE
MEDEPTWRERLGAWAWGLVRPLWTWRGALALLFAVAPINAAGDSAASAWYETVAEAREMGIVIGYIVGLTPLAFAGWALSRVGVTVPRVWLLLVTGIGATGAMSWYDIVQLLTGVTR